ncbi:excinuclease ABC subunit UvrC [Sesbania bispinosa]|nr:excinuclease ABC subunit UvrC [Sesbania bispinosa]
MDAHAEDVAGTHANDVMAGVHGWKKVAARGGRKKEFASVVAPGRGVRAQGRGGNILPVMGVERRSVTR